MKRMTLDEWEEKYIINQVARFDPKYTMFSRNTWDPEIKDLLEDWSVTGTPRAKAGYDLEALALRWGSNVGTQMGLFDKFKPTPKNRAVAAAIAPANTGRPSRDYIPPEGVQVNTSDLDRITLMVKKAVKWFGADLVGICRLDRRWLYTPTLTDGGPAPFGLHQEITDEYQYAIVTAYEMDYDLTKYFNTHVANAAPKMGYSRIAVTNAHISAFIRNLGFKAIESGNAIGLSIPMAMQAGLGELGRNGLLITPEFGPRVRISMVITDLPLLADPPIEFGVTEFCKACKKCADKCPSQSIMSGDLTTGANNKSNNTGELKWPINAETCRTHWGRTSAGCVSCIAVCPYNKPYTWFHRFVRWLADHARWADSFYVKMDDWLGYGKAKKADKFWEEWKPRNGYGSG